MKILLSVFVFYMNPETRKLEFLWQDDVYQESMESCKETGDRYKYLIEGAKNIEVRYFCHVQ
jgi:hypothetical protein